MAWDDGLNEFLRRMGPTDTTPIELLPDGVRIDGMMWRYPSNPMYAGMTLSPYGGLSTPQISLLSAAQYTQGALDYLYRLAGRSAPSPLVLDQIVLANVQANTPRGIGAAAGGSGSGGGGGAKMTQLPPPNVIMQAGPPIYDLTPAANMTAAQVKALVESLGGSVASAAAAQQAATAAQIRTLGAGGAVVTFGAAAAGLSLAELALVGAIGVGIVGILIIILQILGAGQDKSRQPYDALETGGF